MRDQDQDAAAPCRVHVYPIGAEDGTAEDSRHNLEAGECWCEPVVEWDLVIHRRPQ